MFGLEASRQRTAAVISFNELLALALDPRGRPVSLRSSLNGEGILMGCLTHGESLCVCALSLSESYGDGLSVA